MSHRLLDRAQAALVLSLSLTMVPSLSCGDDDGGGAAVPLYCARGPSGCRCSTSSFALQPSDTAVGGCDTPPAGTDWTCCHDIDAHGESTECACGSYGCFVLPDAGECRCEYWGYFGQEIPETAIAVPECTPTGIYNECNAAGGTCVCWNNVSHGPSTIGCPPPDAQLAAQLCGPGTYLANVSSTCRGLRWRR